MGLVRLNREQRRSIDARVRDNGDAAWFEIKSQHFEVSEKGIEIGVICNQHDVTFVLSYVALALFGFEMKNLPNTPADITNEETDFAGYIWRWTTKRRGYYPDVLSCVHCGNFHIPVLTQKSLRLILAEARNQGFYGHEPQPAARPSE